MKRTLAILVLLTAAISSLAAEYPRPKNMAAILEIPKPTIADQLATAKFELAKLRERYRDKHPEVIRQLAKIAELEKSLSVEKSRK